MSVSLSRRNNILAALSLLLLLTLWQLLAMTLHSNTLPEPARVATVFWQAVVSGELPYHLGVTLLRLIGSFSISMLLGCAIGILLGRNKTLDAFFDNWLVIFLNVPALVTIILCYVWFGLVESAAILAVVINKLPNVVVTIREGTRTLDRDLLEMAQSYRFSKRKTFIHVIWPQLHPFVMAATRSGLALIWKIILVVELLGRSNGMGYQLHLFFQLFDVASLLAYTVAFVAVIQLIEVLFLKPLDRKAQSWRREFPTRSRTSSILGGRRRELPTDSRTSSVPGGRRLELSTDNNTSSVPGGRRLELSTDNSTSSIPGGRRLELSTDNSTSSIPGGRRLELSTDNSTSSIPGDRRSELPIPGDRQR